MKETTHLYKGFEIIGTTRFSSGVRLNDKREWSEGAIKRNYNIKKDGRYIFPTSEIIEKLSDAKEEVDKYIERKKINPS